MSSSTETEQERAFIFGPVDSKSLYRDERALDELESLVESAGGMVVGKMVQNIRSMSPSTYFGKGKIEELRGEAHHVKANVAVFDQELTPAQARNIERMLDIRVIDRTELILDIFANRARTQQAKLQVSLAQLKYKLPRLKRMWVHLDRIHAAIGARGPGETQIETDRRLIRTKIKEYTLKLDKMKQRQQRTVNLRKDFKVSLVGYTNAGKSTLLQSLTGAETYVADQLFATLDTTTRKLQVKNMQQPILISDTVGFVNHLPHQLVTSFHATLMEAMDADLLLHVVDSSSPGVMEQIDTVEKVLSDLDCEDIPTIVIANKTDRESSQAGCFDISRRYPDAIRISAKTKGGIDELIATLVKEMSEQWLDIQLLIPYTKGGLVAKVRKCSRIIKEDSLQDGMNMHIQIHPGDFKRLELNQYQCNDA